MADDNLLTVHLVTPERVLLEGQATEVLLRTAAGDLTFLPGHTPLVGTVEPGVVRVARDDGRVERIATHGGFAQVENHPAGDEAGTDPGTSVTLLVGIAELAEEIDTDRARVALEAAEARVTELGGGVARPQSAPGEGEEIDPELVDAEAALLRAQVRLEAVDAASGANA